MHLQPDKPGKALIQKVNNQPVKGKKQPDAAPQAEVGVPKDEVLVGGDDLPKVDGMDTHDSNPVEETPKKKNVGRRVRKTFLNVASGLLGAGAAVTSIPKGIKMALDTKAGKSDEVKRLNAARISTLTSVASSAGIGLAVLGPVGMVVGGVIGYVNGTMANHLASRSGVGDQQMQKISDAVTESVGESKGVWGTAKAVYTGAKEGIVEGFKTKRTTSRIQMAGVMDGVTEAVDDWKSSESKPLEDFGAESPHGPIKQTLLAAGGVLGGVAGVMINAPGGMVVGQLESLKETSSHVPTEMEKTVMLWSTNVGKFLPAALASAFIGGWAGVAASTAIGITTASLASIIDGRLGVNQKIARPVKEAVKEAHGEEDVKENLRAYHRAGKGAVVGLAAGIREGWKAGFQGGVEIVKGSMDTVPESVDHEAKNEKETPPKEG